MPGKVKVQFSNLLKDVPTITVMSGSTSCYELELIPDKTREAWIGDVTMWTPKPGVVQTPPAVI